MDIDDHHFRYITKLTNGNYNTNNGWSSSFRINRKPIKGRQLKLTYCYNINNIPMWKKVM
jgi:hypothetical protein